MPNYAGRADTGAGVGGLTLRADTEQFRALLGKSSSLDKKLKTALRKRIRAAAIPIVREMQAEVLQEPVNKSAKNTRSTGLRHALAADIKVSLMTGAGAGVVIKSSGRLARDYDGSGRRPWRHPVFGDRQTWVTQTGRPYFGRVAAAHSGEVKNAVEAAMLEALESLK